MRTFLIIDRRDGTFGCIEPPLDPGGGWNNTHIVQSYKDFIKDLNPEVDCYIVRAYGRDECGRPIYPWGTEQYTDG